MGVVSPVGSTLSAFWEALTGGMSGIGPITRFDTEAYSSRIAGEVTDFDPAAYIDQKNLRKYDRYSQYAIGAALQAIADAGLTREGLAAEAPRVGVIIASGIGGIETLEQEHATLLARGPARVSPFTIPKIIGNMASGNVAIEIGARGPNFSVVSACASSNHAIGVALDIIRTGRADVVIVGGSEAPITPLSVAGFASMKALSTRNDDPARASRPFDATRDGFVIAEGAGVLVIEEKEHARARGARIYCEVAGYGFTDDAYHMTAPDPDGTGAAEAMRLALHDACVTPDDIDYINAHGTSTPYNDRIETLAIKKVFGDRAYAIAVSSTKSMTGHTLGAAGAIEAIATALTIRHGVIPPTINLEEPDPECDLDYVSEGARARSVRAALSNSLGFGGHNACIVLRQVDS
jgi:3-oxoacyl-[acyl-carrier-protein] synthase II